MIRGLVVNLFLILCFSASHGRPSSANSSNSTFSGRRILEEKNNTSYSNEWNSYEARPPPPLYHSPWQPPEGFYSHFDPWIAEMIRNRVQEMLVAWRNRNLPPLYHCRYSCEQYIIPRHNISPPKPSHESPAPSPAPSAVQQNPTPDHVEESPTPTTPEHNNNNTAKPPPLCPTMAKVIETCTSMSKHEVVDYAFSWTCTYSDECCKATLNVSDECYNLNPSIEWLKTVCCNNGTTTTGGGEPDPNA